METKTNKNLGVVCMILFGLVFYLGIALFLERERYENLEKSTNKEIRSLKNEVDILEEELKDYDCILSEKEMEIKYWGILYDEMKIKYPMSAKKIEEGLKL